MQAVDDAVDIDGYACVIGIDEAGRGPLAGPVVAAAVHLHSADFSSTIRDSKTLSARQREEAFEEIHVKADVGVGLISEAVIDEHNILRATFLAMQNAVLQLMGRKSIVYRPEDVCLLVDGNRFKSDLPYHVKTVVQGDRRCVEIACASIIAKVTRDRILNIYDRIYPQYGFARHKGYPTAKHREAIRRNGPSEIHRRSFTLL